MSNFLNKLFGRTDDGYDDYDDMEGYDLYGDEEPYVPERAPAPREIRQKRTPERTVPFPAGKPGTDHTVVLVEAFDIDTAWPVCDHVKQGRTVICNTERLSPDIRMRFQDIVSGSAYAIGGLLQAVSQFIFVFAPSTTNIDFDDGRLAFSTLRNAAKEPMMPGLTGERDGSRYGR
ncbi:MAG TPA: cell division protein SepF [Clostridiaceae bacterium]|nr:cell division protein SepF [Clostridiaceae bacterium]